MPASRRFTEIEDEFIRANYLSMPYRSIGLHLGRKPHQIAKRVNRLGLSKMAVRRWTEAEDKVVRSSAGRTIASVASELGRRKGEVSSRARKLGLGPWRKRAGYKRARGHVVREYVQRRGKSVRRMEHRAVMEERLGRDLQRGEVVHHIDLDKSNNRRANLYLCNGVSEHMRIHRSLDKLVSILLQRDIIIFNRRKGIYQLCETDK